MRDISIAPMEIIATLLRNRSVIFASVKREIVARYRGSLLGLLWALFTPTLMLVVYTLVFAEVFKVRWSVESDSTIEYALVVFVGLIIFNLFAECVNRAPLLVVSNPNYVKKVVFPIEILPFVSWASAFYHLMIGFGIWGLAYLVFFGGPPVTALLLPLVLIPFSMFVLGVSWMLASLGVFLRDISQLVGVVVTALMLLSPIFYPPSALPEDYRHLLYLNPLTPAVEMARDVLFWGRVPHLEGLCLYWVFSGTIAWLGFALFQKIKKGFADVL